MLIIAMTCLLSLGNSDLSRNIEFFNSEKLKVLEVKNTGARHKLITSTSELSYSSKAGNKIYSKMGKIIFRTSVNNRKITLYNYATGKSICRIGIKKTHLNILISKSKQTYRIDLSTGKLEDADKKFIARTSFTVGSHNNKVQDINKKSLLTYKFVRSSSAGLIWKINVLSKECRAILIAELISLNL